MSLKKVFKSIYQLVPFKKEIFIVIRYFFRLPENIYKHLHFKKTFTVKADKTKSFKIYHSSNIEENELFWKGLHNSWEKKSIALWIELLKNTDIVFDIGANTGLYSLVAKCYQPNSKVYAFEPIKGVYNILKMNNEINQYDIHTFETALSNENGTAKIYLPHGHDFAYSVTVNENTISSQKTDEVEIEILRLDTFIEQNNIQHIDLMKIDVETHEPQVLEGMGSYLKKFQPTFIIEILDDVIAEKLNVIFEGMGYLYFNIDDENNSIRKVAKLTKSDHWNFLICKEDKAKILNLI